MSETIPADVLLFRHQEIQENLDVNNPDLPLQLFEEKCLTRQQCGQLLASGRTPHQKINLLLSYLLKSNSVNPLRSLICSLNSTLDYEPHHKLAAILSASNNIQTPHPLMPLKVKVDSLKKKKEELRMLIDIHALLPLLNKQQLLTVSEYCAIVDTESQTLRFDLLLKSLQRHPDAVSKLVYCLREDKSNPSEHSELANFIIELNDQTLHVEKERVTPVTFLMRKLQKRYRERRVKLHAQWPPLLNQEIVEPRLVLTETESSSIGSTDGPISLEYKALFKNDTHERKVRKLVVLGEAGVGKSTFCEKLLCEWGEDTGTLSEYQLVFFVSLHMKEVASSKSLNAFLSHSYQELGDSVGKYLGDGEGCLFILDGWDELPDLQLHQGSIFHDLLSDKCLPFASVIVTSRTTASRDLYKMPSIDRFVTLQGFSKEDIESYVKSKFITPEQSAPLLQSFSDNPVLESVCTNPLNCVIICDLWKSKRKHIPLKATELYNQIVFSIVRREIDRNFPQYKDATSLNEVLPLVDKLFNLAFTGLKQNKTEFQSEEVEGKFDSTSRDLPIVFQSLGLLQSRLTFTAVGCSLSFHFNNVTFQEYFAAWYLLSLSELDQIAACRKLFKVPRFQKVWQFYFGLQCQKVMHVPEGVISKCLKTSISNDNYKIHLCRCAYEADNDVVNMIVAANLNGEFESYGDLSEYDCLAVAHVISQTKVSLKIMLKYSHCGDRGMMVIVRSLINFQSKVKIEKLHLPCADITTESFRYLSYAYNTFKPLKELDLTSNNVGPSGAIVLAHILEVGSSLKKINLKNMRIDESGAAKLIPNLANHKQLTELVLSGNLLGVLGVEQLAKCLQGLQELKVFRIRGVVGDTSADEAAIASLLDTVALHCSNIEKLDISCNSLSLAGAEAFGRALVVLKHPKNVWVNKAKFTDEGMHRFANCLTSMKKCLVPTGRMISHLELLENDLHAEGICQLVEIVNNGSLPVTRLYLGGNSLGSEGALQLGRILGFEHCQVSSLGLSKCNLGSKGAVILLRALSSNTSLDDINLTDNKIGKSNEADMSTFIDQLLEPSQVHSCTTKGSDLKRFCSTLKTNTNLKYLRISDNYFSGYGIEILLAFLTVCQSLKTLTSRSCQIGSDDLMYNRFQTTFSEVATSSQTLFTHPELQKWSLEDNKIQEDATFVFFKLRGTPCPQLNCISLKGNPAHASLEAQGLNLESMKFSREGSNSAELEGRKGLERKISGSSTDSVDSLYKSFYREFSRASSTTSTKSFDEEDMRHNISSVDAPKITQNPENQSVTTGTDITFTVEATGDDLHFQWQKDSQDIDSSDSQFSFNQTDGTSTLKIHCVKKSDKGHYKCLVRNPVEQQGKVSSEAELRVFDASCITQNPANQSVTTGADITFTVEATGDELHFQWQKDSQDIDSSNSRFSFNQTDGTSTLKIHCVKKSDKGHYKCLVKNPVEQRGKVSSEAELRVFDASCITQNPANQSVTTGADITFTVEATGDELHFQWQKDSQDIDSSNSRFSFNQTDGTSTLKIHCVKKSDKGHYKCLVKNPVEQRGKVSSEAELRVFDPSRFTQNPKNQSVTTGADITFTVEATGDELHFQWQKDSQDIDSSDSRFSFNQTDGTSTLKIHCVKKSDKGHYKCLVKNPVEKSEKTSAAAQLTVGCNWKLPCGIFSVLVILLAVIRMWCLPAGISPYSPEAPRLKFDENPTFPALRDFPGKHGSIDIAADIDGDYNKFGTLLLDDKNGKKMSNIEMSKHGDTVDITVTILQMWMDGKGRMPVTWQTLVTCLQKTGLHVLADNIKSVLSEHTGNKDLDHSF